MRGMFKKYLEDKKTGLSEDPIDFIFRDKNIVDFKLHLRD